MHEQVSALLTAVLERNGLTRRRPDQRLVHRHPRPAQRLPGRRRPQARHRRRAADLRPGAGGRGRHAAGGAYPRPRRDRARPSPTSTTSTSAPPPRSARTSPSNAYRPRHRHRTHRHLRRARAGRARGAGAPAATSDPEQARTAAALGAGTDGDRRGPGRPGDRRRAARPRGREVLAGRAAPRPAPAATWTWPASRAARAGSWQELGGDLASYLGTHPMSGREQSGPLAATADLFEGRPWVLTPTPETDTEVLNLALELVALCRAVPVVMDADAHDRAVALVSHTPQLLSSMVAARLEARRRDGRTAVRPGHPGRDPHRRLRPRDVGRDPLREPGTGRRRPRRASRPTWTRTVRALRAPGLRRRGEAGAAASPASRTCCGAATPAGPGCPASTARRRPPTDGGGADQRPSGRAGPDLRRRRRGRRQHRGRPHRARHGPAGRARPAHGGARRGHRCWTAALRDRGWSLRQQ